MSTSRKELEEILAGIEADMPWVISTKRGFSFKDVYEDVANMLVRSAEPEDASYVRGRIRALLVAHGVIAGNKPVEG